MPKSREQERVPAPHLHGLLFTHKLRCKEEAELNVIETGEASPEDKVAGIIGEENTREA